MITLKSLFVSPFPPEFHLPSKTKIWRDLKLFLVLFFCFNPGGKQDLKANLDPDESEGEL